jgi:hypothetical protein
MAKVSATGYLGVTVGRTKKDGTPRFLAWCEGAYLGSFSTAFEAARAHDRVSWMGFGMRWQNFPPLRYERRACLPGMTLRDYAVAKARHAMLTVPTRSRFEREALLRRAGL